MEVNESSCQNVNCEYGPHEMCNNCNPKYEVIKNCILCEQPSKGGRLTCCGYAICYTCFNDHFKTICVDRLYMGFILRYSNVISYCPSCEHLMVGYIKVNERDK